MKYIFLSSLLFLVFTSVYCQTNFKGDLKKANPVDTKLDIPLADALAIHQKYLEKAISKNDTLKQIYGYFYLYVDYYKMHDYPKLQESFLKASNLVENSNNPNWKAAICMRKAHLLELFDNDIPNAILKYIEAKNYCTIAKDSFCIAECLEQLSNLNASLGNYTDAHKYFNEAITLMKKFAGKAEMAMTYNNYSNLLSDEGNYNDAEKYIDSAIVLAKINNDIYKEMMYSSNLAALQNKKGNPRKAISMYEKIIEINKSNKAADLLLYNYTGIADAYEAYGNLQKTNEYTHKYYILNDSINGAKVKLQIAKLELENDANKKDMLIAKTKRTTERLFVGLLLSLILLGVVLVFWFYQKRNSTEEQKKNMAFLDDLTKVIKEKNAIIHQQNEELNIVESIQNTDDDVMDLNIFETRILNDEDVSAFKSYFEKAYPMFLMKVRKKWPSITSAEERLMMLIKLKIKSKEAADILGISSDSIKKSRNRLRKRLELDIDVNLDDYISKIT